MPIHPALIVYVIAQYHAEVEALACSRRLERQARWRGALGQDKDPVAPPPVLALEVPGGTGIVPASLPGPS